MKSKKRTRRNNDTRPRPLSNEQLDRVTGGEVSFDILVLQTLANL